MDEFKNSRINLQSVDGPLNQEEKDYISHMLSGKEPGPSHFKMAAVRFFGRSIQKRLF